jgi:hypothetical protein
VRPDRGEPQRAYQDVGGQENAKLDPDDRQAETRMFAIRVQLAAANAPCEASSRLCKWRKSISHAIAPEVITR